MSNFPLCSVILDEIRSSQKLLGRPELLKVDGSRGFYLGTIIDVTAKCVDFFSCRIVISVDVSVLTFLCPGTCHVKTIVVNTSQR